MGGGEVQIHPAAVVSDGASLGVGVRIGPFAVVEGDVELGDRVEVGPHAHIAPGARISEDVKIFAGSSVSQIPQDLKFAGEESTLEVGPRTIIREFCTLHRGTEESGKTVVGADCLLMNYAHVAHDCIVGDHAIIANAVQLGGHVVVGEWAIIGGSTPVHQFCRVGEHAMVGGGFRVVQDVPPYIRAAGEPLRPSGLNSVGLARRGFDEETISTLKKAYRILFRSSLNTSKAIEQVREELPAIPEIDRLCSFIQSSERGIVG